MEWFGISGSSTAPMRMTVRTSMPPMIEVVGVAVQRGADAIDEAGMVADPRLQLVESAIDEVVADVGAAQVDARVADGLLLCRRWPA